jgi:hypothetical protein
LPYAQSIKLLHCIALPGLTKLRSPGWKMKERDSFWWTNSS